MAKPETTADYRKYPKGPNFLLIVVLASIVLLLILAGAYVFLHGRSRKLMPHPANPEPNSQLVLPSAGSAATKADRKLA